MKTNKFILLLVSICLALSIEFASGVTFPSGTVFTVRTTSAISSRDVGGTQFWGKLLESIPGKGGFTVAAGLGVVGIVVSPRVEIGSSVRPLTLALTKFSFEGRLIPIKTQPYEVQNAGIKTRSNRIRVTGGALFFHREQFCNSASPNRSRYNAFLLPKTQILT